MVRLVDEMEGRRNASTTESSIYTKSSLSTDVQRKHDGLKEIAQLLKYQNETPEQDSYVLKRFMIDYLHSKLPSSNEIEDGKSSRHI